MRIPLLKSQFKNEATLQLYQRKASRKTGRTEEQAGLSDRDKVLIRDTWNKFQAHQEVGLEAFVERVFYESPATESRMGVLGDEVEEIIFGLFDLCIRSLHPHTENLGREAAETNLVAVRDVFGIAQQPLHHRGKAHRCATGPQALAQPTGLRGHSHG